MTAPAEGPATVTPHTDSCRGPRGLNACDCGAEQRAVDPATVTLTDAELEPLRVALMVAYASQPMGYDRAKRATDRTVAEVVAPFAARVDALTADLAAARDRADDAEGWQAVAADRGRVLTRLTADLAAANESWRAAEDESQRHWRVIANAHAETEGLALDIASLTDDVEAVRIESEQRRRKWQDAERVIANVRALADEWRYKGEFGWGPWQTGEGPDHEGEVLDRASTALRALLPAAPTEEGS
jgi:hypothetical protein